MIHFSGSGNAFSHRGQRIGKGYALFRPLYFLLVLLLLWPVHTTAGGEALSDLLEGIRERYGHVSGLSLTYKREITTRSMAMLGSDLKGDLATGMIHFKPPNLLKLEQKAPHRELILSDGQILWWYIPRKGLVYRFASQELGKEIRLLYDIFQGLKAVEERFDVLLMDPEESGDHQLKLVPNPPWPEVQHILLSVSRGDHTIDRVEIHNQIGGVTRFELGGLSVREGFPEDFFRFRVPQGVSVIEQGG